MVKMVITEAGRQALINSSQTGTAAVTIAKIGVGSGRYTATETQTTLMSEIKRLPIVEGGLAGDNSFHVAFEDESSDAYTVYEFGLFLDDSANTLFAVYSSSEIILQKTTSGIAILAVDVALEDIDAEDIHFGDVTFSNTAATTTNAGVIEIATNDEVLAGTDTQRALTPANIQVLTGTANRMGLCQLASPAVTIAGTTASRVVTPAGLKATIDDRLADNTETIAGTDATKMITPASLAARTATTARTGLVELATDSEAVAGTDNARAVTPTGLKAAFNANVKEATTSQKGIVELATTDEAKTGTDSSRAVTPEGLKAVFTENLKNATTSQRGIIEIATDSEAMTGTDNSRAVTAAGVKATIDNRLATDDEVIAGTDTTKMITPSGLKARTATTERTGLVELATDSEAAAGTDSARAVTPAGVKNAIAKYTGDISSAKVTATGGTTARALKDRFADSIAPKDFGAAGNSTTNDTAAFTALEAKVKGRDVDLEGLTYLVNARPVANNYYNGYFKIGSVTVKPVYDFYKYGGTAPCSINTRRDFSDTVRGGAALLAGNYIRKGVAAGAIVASSVWDDVNRYFYTLHVASGNTGGIVNAFSCNRFGANVEHESKAYTTSSPYIGIQGLGIQYLDGGQVKLWASMAYEAAGASVTSKGTKAIRFNPPTAENQNIDSSVEIFNLFPEVSGSSQAVTVAVSYSGKYLIAKYNASGNGYRIRVFKLSDLTTAGDYSEKYINEFTLDLTNDIDGGVEKSLRAMACDDRFIYYLAADTGVNDKHSIYISDMYGNIVDEYRNLSVGKSEAQAIGSNYYAPRSLFFMSLNGQMKLCLQTTTGNTTGNRICQVLALNTRQSYFFPTGSEPGNTAAVAIDEQGRINNAEGVIGFSVYPSGTAQYLQARAGANQMTLARFSNDDLGTGFSFYKSRGAKVATSKSVLAGDTIGTINFMVDNGNIDYSDAALGACAGRIGGYVYSQSKITSSGTTDLGVRGAIRITANKDENNIDSGIGLEINSEASRPTIDNTCYLGTSNRRWKAIYAATGVISTSDERQKKDIADIPAAVLNAWGNVNFKQFHFKEGADETLYVGVVAQQIIAAFTAEGLSALDYGLVSEETDDEGNTIYGVRYDEVMILEAAYQRTRLDAIEARLNALENA